MKYFLTLIFSDNTKTVLVFPSYHEFVQAYSNALSDSSVTLLLVEG